MNHFKTIFMLNKKQWRYRILFAVFSLSSALFLIFTLNEQSPFRTIDARSERQTVNSILGDFRTFDLDSAEANNEPLYVNAVKQSEKLATQEQATLFENFPLIARSGLELAQLREEFYQIKNAEKYRHYIPTPHQNQLNKIFFETMVTSEQPITLANDNLQRGLMLLLALIGLAFAPVCSLITSDFLLAEVKHFSVNAGYPLPINKRLLQKILFLLLFFLSIFLCILGITLLLSSVYPLGDWTYPVPIYLLTTYRVVPFWLYLFIVTLFFLMIVVFTAICSLFFNTLTKNVYLTFFASFILYSLPFFLPTAAQKLWFLPSNYLNPIAVCEGTFVVNQLIGGPIFGLLVLLMWSVGLFILTRKTVTLKLLKELKR